MIFQLISRNEFIRYSILLVLFILTCANYRLEAAKPNIVLLFVDDWGWSDVGYRNPKFETPHIDQLKKESMEFTRAYIPTPTCSPSRASLLTGKEAIRLDMPRHIMNESNDNKQREKYNYWPSDPTQRPSINWLPLEEETYAEYLKQHGYFNMFIGKWHLGHEPFHPIHQGFDEQYGTGNWGHPKNYYQRFFKDDEVLSDIPKDRYLTDVLTDKACDFITEYNNDQPFQLSFWYYNVHGPHIGRKDLVKKYLNQGLTGKDAEYAAMVEAMDRSVGRIQKALIEKGIADQTILLLTSDQGGYFSNAPLSGGKRGGNTLGEGGARIPFLIRYPPVTTPGSESDFPIQTIDIFPTLSEIATHDPTPNKEINGKSILPLLKGDDQPLRDLFFFRAYEDQSSAIIRGDWKLIKYISQKYELFNIKNDPSEATNLFDMKPKVARSLKSALEKWEKKAVPSI